MNVIRIRTEDELPSRVVRFKEDHFRDIFGVHKDAMLTASPILAPGEEVLLCEIDGRAAGWVHFRFDTYFVQFRNFAVHPDFRGQGVASLLLERLRTITAARHYTLTSDGRKPDDIKLMYLKSLVYMDHPDAPGHAFEFGRFLKRMGFKAYPYNKLELTEEERAAVQAYSDLYPDHIGDLKVFKMLVVDDGVEFKPEAREELMRLKPDELAVVRTGLRVKLGNFNRSGRVSYRYDICPICAFMGSSEQNDAPCQRCYIYVTCMEPFREVGRFKEDYQVSARYFEEMARFLDEHYGAA